jgi:hypothetical protein
MIITKNISYKNSQEANSLQINNQEFSLLSKLLIDRSLLKRFTFSYEVSDLTQNMINSKNFVNNFTISSSTTTPYYVSPLATTSTNTELDGSLRTIYMIAIVIMFLLVLFVISGRVIYSSNDSYSNMFYLKYHRNSSLAKAIRECESSSNFTGSKFELNIR